MQQMNAIAPGGIASMMRGMPQGIPQPKPQPAGIALSSINEIANAQGTKTIPDGLKPLLALEQALSQVKAAQNQQMLQQQIPQGTIQDQYVSQADSIIQQAKGVAATSAEQERKKQAAAQQLIAGIAKAPGAQQMPGMAAGGIVAFQEGGESSFIDRLPEEALLRKLRDWIRAGRPSAEKPVIDQIADALNRRREGAEVEDIMRDTAPTRQPLPQTPLPPEMGVPQQTAPTAPTAPTVPAAPAMRMPPAQVTSKVPVAPGAGIAQGPAAQVVRPEAMGQGISPSPLEKAVEERATAMMGMRPETEIEAARKRYSQTMDPALQAQRAERQRALQEREAMYRQDPARQRTQAIAEMLRGYAQPIPGGGIGQFLMNAGAAGNRYSQAQQEQARKNAFDLQKLRAEMAGADVSAAKDLFSTGEEKYKPALEAGAAGVRAGTDLLGTRERAATAAANRENNLAIARIQQAAQNRPGETERMIAEYQRLKKTDPNAAAEYLNVIETFKGAGKGVAERQRLSELKVLQKSYEDQAGNFALPEQTRKEAAALLKQVNQEIAAMSGIGSTSQQAPAVGTVMQGYRFKGGDPSNKNNWEKV